MALAMACAEPDMDGDVEHVALDFPSLSLDKGDLGGIADTPIDSGPCGCENDYTCMSNWAQDNFNCGVCVTVACGDDNANVCTPLCEPAPIDGYGVPSGFTW